MKLNLALVKVNLLPVKILPLKLNGHIYEHQAVTNETRLVIPAVNLQLKILHLKNLKFKFSRVKLNLIYIKLNLAHVNLSDECSSELDQYESQIVHVEIQYGMK